MAGVDQGQRRVLTRAFVARFFDNDLTGGSQDLKQTFIWVMAALAAPGLIMPVFLMGWDWGVVGRGYGYEVLREITRNDKILALGLGMVASGLVSAVVWSSLLIDRRDALVIGVLPVRASVVVQAKIRAIAAYVAVVSVVMHLPASLTFGFLLSTGDVPRALAGSVAHFVASCLASGFVLFAVTAVQALMMLVAGPTSLARRSSLVQAAFVAAVLFLLVSLPAVGASTQREMGSASAKHTRWGVDVTLAEPVVVSELSPWLELSPPVWFFGVYESMLGAESKPVLPRLAMRGLFALGAVVVITLVALPLGYRRLMAGAVATPEGLGRTGRLAAAGERLTRVITRPPGARAALQLLLSTAARAPRHRFLAAATLGVIGAFALPVILLWSTTEATPTLPPVEWLALPFYGTTCLLVGLRLLVGTPGDLRAAWVVAAADTPPRVVTSAVRRLFLFAGVAPWAFALTPVYWWFWGARAALTQGVLVAATGVLCSTVLLFRWSAMPCSEPLPPLEQGHTARRIGVGAGMLFWVTGVPAVVPILSQRPVGLAILLSLIALAIGAIVLAERRAGPMGRRGLASADAAFQTLGLH